MRFSCLTLSEYANVHLCVPPSGTHSVLPLLILLQQRTRRRPSQRNARGRRTCAISSRAQEMSENTRAARWHASKRYSAGGSNHLPRRDELPELVQVRGVLSPPTHAVQVPCCRSGVGRRSPTRGSEQQRPEARARQRGVILIRGEWTPATQHFRSRLIPRGRADFGFLPSLRAPIFG